MLKNTISSIIKLKNPNFKFDQAVTTSTLLELLFFKVGCWMRSLSLLFSLKFYPTLFLGRNVRLQYKNLIQFGKWNQIEDNVYISALGKKPIQFGNNVRIGAFSRIITSTSFNNIGVGVKIGHNVGLGEFAYLGGGGGLEIGDDCIIGQYFSCHPENHNFQNTEQLIRLQGVTRKGIKVGENCWIGAKVTLLDGVTIGPNCVIAAGAVVTKSMPANSVIGGVPAKVIKSTLKPKPTKGVLSSGRLSPKLSRQLVKELN